MYPQHNNKKKKKKRLGEARGLIPAGENTELWKCLLT
jgi:hypothetical protein